MRYGNAASWSIRSSGPDRHLSTLVYVRDAAGLTGPADYPLPPLAPAVPLHAELAPHATAAAAEAWDRWWEGCFDPAGRLRRPDEFGPRPMDPPEPGTDLRFLFDAVVDEAHDWHREREREFHERFHEQRRRQQQGGGGVGRTVRRIEQELGRTSAPFALEVLMVPLDRRWGRRMDAELVVVSELLWYDEDACDLFLDRILRTLV